MNNIQIKELLKKRNLKATTARLSLLTKMEGNGSAMSYSAIQAALNPIDRVTLYRTIESLKEKGIIHKAFQENSEIYYALCSNRCEENHHHHYNRFQKSILSDMNNIIPDLLNLFKYYFPSLCPDFLPTCLSNAAALAKGAALSDEA